MMAPETVVTVEHNKPASPQGAPQQQGGALDWIKINVDYFKTPPGLLKVIQLVLGILCMALASRFYSGWFVFVAVTSFIVSLMWSFVYLFSIREAFREPCDWVRSDFVSMCIHAVFYLTAFIVLFAATVSYGGYCYGNNIAAAVLGILCMALASPFYSGWFVFVAVTSFITTLMWSFVYLLSIREALKIPINWVLSELFSTCMEAFLYLIAFIVLFASTVSYGGYYYGNNIAAAVFGMFNTLAYVASSFLLWQEHKASVPVTA